MRRRWITNVTAFVLLAAASAIAPAQGPGAVRKTAESSVLVSGYIVVETDGRTGGVELYRPEALPAEIAGFVTDAARAWKFKPVEQDGKVVRVRAPMIVRVVAKKSDGGAYMAEIRSASFGDQRDGASTDGRTVKAASMPPPKYPRSALEKGVTGTVFVAARVDREGKVVDVIAEQTNLRVTASASDMRKFRTLLENSALAAAKDWRFRPPTVGESAQEQAWSVRIPVAYSFGPPSEDTYGRWETYIPGPRSPILWESRVDLLAGGADAVADGSVQQLGAGPQLLTPLGPG